MLDPTFFPRLIKGWEEADLKADGARSWMGAMVDRRVNRGTTLYLLWLAKFGIDAARHDPDRRLIPPMTLERQKQMVAHMGGNSHAPRSWRSGSRRHGLRRLVLPAAWLCPVARN